MAARTGCYFTGVHPGKPTGLPSGIDYLDAIRHPSLLIIGSFYVTMVFAGYFVEVVFGALGLVPIARNVHVIEARISFNYTTVLNIVFLMLGAVLVWRFLRTGGG